MKIFLNEIEKNDDDSFFEVTNAEIGLPVGSVCTCGNHIAYDIKPEFRGRGAATEALKIISSKIKDPVLEIRIDNFPSKRVAVKAGYSLVEIDGRFEIYKFTEDTTNRL